MGQRGQPSGLSGWGGGGAGAAWGFGRAGCGTQVISSGVWKELMLAIHGPLPHVGPVETRAERL